jgi:hypothetical protein
MFQVADLIPTEEQELIKHEFSRLLDGVWSADSPRNHAADSSIDEVLWTQLSGWISLGGAPFTEVCRALEIAGERLLPGAFTATVGLLAPLLRLVDPERFRELVTGRLRGSASYQTEGSSDGATDGVVLAAQDADVIAFVEGTTVLLVQPERIETTQTADLTRTFGRVPSGAWMVVGEYKDVQQDFIESWMARCAVTLAADMVGSARWLCSESVDYAKKRHQFGRAIGEFQAVQHRLVDMTTRLQRASAAVDYAATCIDGGTAGAVRAAHVAKSVAGETVLSCAQDALQLHGATGFTWESDIHLHLRRGYVSNALFGDVSWHRSRLASSIFNERDWPMECT